MSYYSYEAKHKNSASSKSLGYAALFFLESMDMIGFFHLSSQPIDGWMTNAICLYQQHVQNVAISVRL